MSISDESVGLEMNLLESWEGWDSVDVMAFVFYDAVLKVPIGKFSAGDKVKSIEIDYGKSKVGFMEEDGNVTYFPVALSLINQA